MTAPESVTLLPCPFCGGDELSYGWSSPGYDGSMHSGNVECHSCNAFVIAETQAEAIAAWNTRQSAEAASRDRDARLEEALAFYAQERNWRAAGMYMCGHAPDSACAKDGGNRARAALAHRSQEGEG